MITSAGYAVWKSLSLKPESEIDTSGWQTYTNDTYGFQVKYPKDWQISPFSDDTDPIFFPKGGVDPYSPTAQGDEYWITLVRIVALRGARGASAEEEVKIILDKEKHIAQKIEIIPLPNEGISVEKRLNLLQGKLELSVFIPNRALSTGFLHFAAPYNQRSEKERREAENIFDAIVKSIRFLRNQERGGMN